MKTEKKIYFPLFASRQLNGGFQSEEESSEVWKTVRELPDERRNILLSQNLAEAIARLDEEFHIPEQFVEYVTVLVRDLFFGNFSEIELLRALRGEFAKLPNIPLDPVIQHIQLNVFKAKPDPEPIEEEEQEAKEVLTHPENIKQYTLLDAMSRFPNLSAQFITKENIKLKNQNTPVRPTLSNWLKNYRDELGIGKHDAVARAHFLFESPNAKRLSDWERERLHALVRSLEDEELLDINVQKQEIVFLHEKKEELNSTLAIQRSKPVSAPLPDLFDRFQNLASSPREQLKNVGTQTYSGGKPVSVPVPVAQPAAAPVANIPQKAIAPSQPAAKQGGAEQALGTIRFSTKHVLPAEKYTQPEEQKYASMPGDPRLEHFRPQGTAIPSDNTQPNTFLPKENAPVPVATVPQAAIPSIPPAQPAPRDVRPNSIFRIKPNKY